ncbi:hypothetical protein HWD35_02890 [Tsukamurella tyrosinosolvens]|uniref:DUF6069 family protein n=1 Tax=Tsukamurella tyrosinosolvens TaxID=57704 RepID=UPI0007981A15|nr:DUF6069 family protein [Tsukamurella tyrosinosolvens]KXP05750.1 hypothetical protein AXK59_09565 [Tsukamurella tyrosinosolvens]KZL95569.1 hypothetical protein AXX05_20590 [Tsukamurella tyrosinosolvens]MCA4993646.1 hypothetical protein [Tsukamurella tyrosinosolvens]WEL94869.1 DUF6069 family protein [Tsukamurella tyrosinosolvens]
MTAIDTAAPSTFRLTRTTAVLGAVGLSLLANLALRLVGLAAGGDFTMTDEAGIRASVAPGGVVLMTVAPLAVGMTAAVLLSKLWVPILRVAAVIGAAASLGTIAGTLAADFDGPSTVMLSLMHVVIAVVLVVALEALFRRVR